MMRKVRIDAWQMQCCGDPFHVGQRVEFATVAPTDLAFLVRVFGEEGAARLTDREDRHDVGAGPPTPIAGVVQGIEAISCRFDPMGHPVTGTTHLEAREHADGASERMRTAPVASSATWSRWRRMTTRSAERGGPRRRRAR